MSKLEQYFDEENWIEYSKMIPLIGQTGQDCNSVCKSKRMKCNHDMMQLINTKYWLREFLPRCEKFWPINSLKYWTLGYPAVNDKNCIIQANPSLLGCSGRPEGQNKRICPCHK